MLNISEKKIKTENENMFVAHNEKKKIYTQNI